MAVEARQERRLRLPHDVAGDAHHHVVEAAVLEVVLDARAAGPRDGAVDDVELAVVGAADLVLAPVELLLVGEEAVPVGGNTSLTTICAPAAARRVNISRASS